MTRTLAIAAAALALAGCASATMPERSTAATLVGVGDQAAYTFTDPLFSDLHLKRSRVFTPWNVALKRRDRKVLDTWLKAAQTAGVEPLVSFAVSTGNRCPKRPCKLPTVREYTKAFKAFRKRWRFVTVVSPWNEANHRSQPTFRNPRRAAEYYNVVRKYCRGCKIVAADVIDESNMLPWIKTFKRYAKAPRIWGLHNYKDTNPRRGQTFGGTRKLLKAVRGQVWLTETGGIVYFRLPDGRLLFSRSAFRANKATIRMFSLAKRYRSRIKRLYIYNWREPLTHNRFDAGLVDKDGKARPAYDTVKRNLATPYFNP